MGRDAYIDVGAGVGLERGVAMRLSDGITLYADHYYPPRSSSRPGPNPTLLMRQPYGRDIASTVVYAHPAWFARHGYNVVIQDVRGRGDSEGEFYPFRHEARDGAETIAALRQRPESDGSVAMYGFSYQGMTQLLAAAEAPEGLVCIAPAMTAHDLYHGWFYHHGALRLASSLGWGLQMLKEDALRRKLHAACACLGRVWSNLPAQYLETPYGTHPTILSEGLPTYVCDWFEHDRPGPYWTSMDVSQTVANIRVPALHLSGWYDTYLKGSIDGFVAMRARAAPEARDHQYLVAGPWVHIPWGDRIGAHALGPEAALDTDALLLRWFNHWMKGSGDFDYEPRIRHFAVRPGEPNRSRWHTADEWPSAAARVLYLHSEGRASSSKGDGSLTPVAPSSQEPPDIFIFDPEVPVVAPGGLGNAAGPSNQAALELGNNVLNYTTAALEEPLHIFGIAEVELHVATSAAFADLAAKLICLQPSGEAIFISIGYARSTHIFRGAEGATYTADTPQLWRFQLEPTSCVFSPGDRIRLEIASSAFPLYDRNAGTGVAARLAEPANWRRSTQIVFHDSTRASNLRLPVLEGQWRPG